MNRPRVCLVLALLGALGACAAKATPDPISRKEVDTLMDTQKACWNKGDLEGFVSYYDATMTFSGSSGVTRGTKGLLARYKKGYPTAKERGVLSFVVTDLRPLGGETALVLGEYAIAREKPANGFFSLVVHRTAEGLRILHDHTSAAETEKK